MDRRVSPDELLRRVQAEERRERRGRLKVFLGYAPRVGKSLRMFDEGRRRKERGQDVVVAAAQEKVTDEVRELVARFEVIPHISGAIDLPGVFRRHPQVCLIDELAYDNPPGSRNAQRWQDVEEILDQGIAVITALNVHHIREQQAEVERISGKRAARSVPETFLRAADEIEVVDTPADTRQLAELRELALLVAADVVDHQLQEYLDAHGVAAHWGTQERILVCLTPRSDAETMLTSGLRNSRRFHGALLVVYMEQENLKQEDRAALERHLAMARELGAEVHCLKDGDFGEAIVEFARRERITQIFLGHPLRAQSPVDTVIEAAEDFDVRLFPHGGNGA
jgi:two-component system sensor histidine kinase KdpD